VGRQVEKVGGENIQAVEGRWADSLRRWGEKMQAVEGT
jgi:hypothetical protein